MPILGDFSCGIAVNAAGTKNNPDTFTFDQTMARDDKKRWIELAKEIKDLEDHGCWEEVPIKEAKEHKIIPSQWIFCLKQKPDGTITKHKGQIVLHRDLMKEIHDLTSPVVAFSTEHIFLLMLLFLN